MQRKSVDLAKLSARKLQELIDKRGAIHGAIIDACIAAGMGTMRGSDIAKLALQSELTDRVVIAREWVRTQALCSEAWAEEAARKRYHGSTRPIRSKP